MDNSTPGTNLSNQQIPVDERRTIIMRRMQIYRIMYLSTGIVAVLVLYGLPAISVISKNVAERLVMLVALPYFFFNAYIAFRWTDDIAQSVVYLQTEHRGYYNLLRVSNFVLPVFRK